MDGWMDGWMGGWMDGWMDGRVSCRGKVCCVVLRGKTTSRAKASAQAAGELREPRQRRDERERARWCRLKDRRSTNTSQPASQPPTHPSAQGQKPNSPALTKCPRRPAGTAGHRRGQLNCSPRLLLREAAGRLGRCATDSASSLQWSGSCVRAPRNDVAGGREGGGGARRGGGEGRGRGR